MTPPAPPTASVPPRPAPRKVAVILSGGGARGAYEVGVLSYVLDAFARLRGRPPRFDILCGTSVGAVNACYLAAHLADPTVGIRRLVDLWLDLRLERVLGFGVRQALSLPRVLFGGGAEGVGLYRSEFLLSGRALASVTEEVQYAAYRALVEQVAPRPVTIRTFDLDEDDLEPAVEQRRGRTRRRGLRGLRLGLAHTEVLWTQLRALVRASAHGPLRIMFPFVTAVEEVRQVRAIVEQVCTDLRALDNP